MDHDNEYDNEYVFAWLERVENHISPRYNMETDSIIDITRILFTYIKSRIIMNSKSIYLYAYVCYVLAAKYHQDNADGIPFILLGSNILCYLYNIKEIKDAEIQILELLNWKFPRRL